MTHLEAADAGVPAHVVRSESAGAPGAGHEALLDVGPHADHGSGLQPGEPGLGTHGVCVLVIRSLLGCGHNIRCASCVVSAVSVLTVGASLRN